MGNDEGKVIATLIPTSPQARAAFLLPHNRGRCVPAPDDDDDDAAPLGSRETTPSSPAGASFTPQLRLSLDDAPRGEGFAFGCDAARCDVQLADRRETGAMPAAGFVSRRHFLISLDGARRRVVLRDCSKVGTSVCYDGQGRGEVRTGFTWVLGLGGFDVVEVGIPRAFISFRVCLNGPAEGGVLRELRSRPDEGSGFTSSDGDLTEGVSSGGSGGRQRPIYLELEKIGEGSEGTVHKVVNVSTGEIYARKHFHGSGSSEQEAACMRRMSHENLVRFVDYQPEPPAAILMEYASMGTLTSQFEIARLTLQENIMVLVQTLRAVEYLHSNRIVHRDIKPTNLLVFSRRPMHVKLTDFGSSKDFTDCEAQFDTCAGTSAYQAPEVVLGQLYDPSVDVWSLGVLTLHFSYDIHCPPGEKFLSPDWQKRIVERVMELRTRHPLVDLLRYHMLRFDAAQRSTASRCLELALDFAPRDEEPDQSRSTTSATTSTAAVLPAEMPHSEYGPRTDTPHVRGKGKERENEAEDDAELVRCFEVCVDGRTFLINSPRGWVDALPVLRVAELRGKEHTVIESRIRQRNLWTAPIVDESHCWIPYAEAEVICEYLDLRDELDAFLQLARQHARDNDAVRFTRVPDLPKRFDKVMLRHEREIHVRLADGWINISHIARLANLSLENLCNVEYLKPIDVVKRAPPASRGKYADPTKAMQLCRELGLHKVWRRLEVFLDHREDVLAKLQPCAPFQNRLLPK